MTVGRRDRRERFRQAPTGFPFRLVVFHDRATKRVELDCGHTIPQPLDLPQDWVINAGLPQRVPCYKCPREKR